MINESRRIAPVASTCEVQQWGLLHDLLNRSFFAAQMTAIRRLVDCKSDLEGKRGVMSLGAIIADMRKRQEQFTRKAVMQAEGLVVDVAAARVAFDNRPRQPGRTANVTHSAFEWRQNVIRHEQFDRLAGVCPPIQSPDDVVAPQVFDRLQTRLDHASIDIQTHVNKFLAHAATPESRRIHNADDLSITVSSLWQAIEVICETASFVSTVLLGDKNLGGLPLHSGDLLEYADRPLMNANDRIRLQEIWKLFDREVQDWDSWGLDEFDRDIALPP